MTKGIRFQFAVLAAIPLLLTPAFLYALAEGWMNFGGGEKDIILVFPYCLWALVFFLCALVLIMKRWPLRRWLVRSSTISTVFIVFLAIVGYLSSWLGIT